MTDDDPGNYMKKSNLWAAFFAGSAFVMALYSLFQDYLGREGYITYVLEHWTPGWYSVPLSVIILVLSVLNFVHVLREKPKPQPKIEVAVTVDGKIDEAVETLQDRVRERRSSFFPEAVGSEDHDG